jgi:hypothetical protein
MLFVGASQPILMKRRAPVKKKIKEEKANE